MAMADFPIVSKSGIARDVSPVAPPKPAALLHDRYRVIQVLGRGGFGVTALAKDYRLPTHPHCVIKQLCPLLQTPEALERARWRFQREARTLAQLGGHAQIPLLLNYFEQRGQFFLVQEFVPGKNLTQLIKANTPWTERQVVQFLADILPVLDYVHRQGVIHRDIKPSNIMRCSIDDRLVLLDFGAVKSLLTAEETPIQHTIQFVGTAGFAPPEQQQLHPCFASDLYALGMTALFLLTGLWPQAFSIDRSSRRVQWASQVSVSKPLQILLDRLLHPSIPERYGSAAEVLQGVEILQNLYDKTNRGTPRLSTPSHYGDLQDCLHIQAPQRRWNTSHAPRSRPK